MEWTLLRATECMRFENHYDSHTGELVLHIDPPNGDRQTQRFATARAYRSWLAALERQLEADHWTPSGDVRDADTSVNASGATIEKTYKSGTRTFDLQLSRRLIEGQVGWTVTDVIERSRVRTRVTIPPWRQSRQPTAMKRLRARVIASTNGSGSPVDLVITDGKERHAVVLFA